MNFMYVFHSLVLECRLLTPEQEALSLPPPMEIGASSVNLAHKLL